MADSDSSLVRRVGSWARRIIVDKSPGLITLSGTVGYWYVKQQAYQAFAETGVQVVDNLQVVPLERKIGDE